LVYFASDIMLKTTPPWKKKKQLALLAAQDSAKNIGLDSVYLTNFADTLIYSYKVGKNEVLSKIAEKFNLSTDSLKAINNIVGDKIVENQRLKVKIRAIHRIKKGEMVANIAKKYGVKTSEILQANRIKNTKQVWADQVLIIPIPSR
jgi:spore germination protein YaaH